MSIEEFFREYFVSPIDERTGYNSVNTLIYAALALLAAYLIYLAFKKLKIKVDDRFVLSIIPFILFGSTLRVVVDANVLPYTYITTTPGIYFLIGFTTLGAVFACHRLKIMGRLWQVGTALWACSLFPILLIAKHFEYFALAILVAGAGFFVSERALKALKAPAKIPGSLAIFSHALDGASTFVTIDVFAQLTGKPYFEQHVVPNMISDVFGGFWAFYLVKLLFAACAVYIIRRSSDMSEQERNYILLLLIIFGLAPGARGALRLLCGV